MRFATEEFHIKSQEEMLRTFDGNPDPLTPHLGNR